MPQPFKGHRPGQTIRPEPEVRERLKQKVAESGVSSLSQYVADLLAIHVGMPELARELGQEVLQLPITAA